MTVVHDASSNPAALIVSATTTNWTHNPTGNPRGVIVLIPQGTAVDNVSAVTYGGVALIRIRRATRSAAEPGDVYTYFLGKGIPAGSQTVAVTTTGTAPCWPQCATVTAAADTELDVENGLDAGIIANPSLALTPTKQALLYYVNMSGLNAPVSTPEAGTSLLAARDLGTVSGHTGFKQVDGPGATTIGWTSASDDVCHAGLAVKEVPHSGNVARPYHPGRGPFIAQSRFRKTRLSTQPRLGPTRGFDGSDDEIILDEGTLDSILNGAWTVACLFKPLTIPDFVAVLSIESSGPTQRAGLWVSDTSELLLAYGGINYTFPGLGTPVGHWYLGVIKKASGTATPRANVYNFSTGTWDTWTDSEVGAASNDATTIIQVRLGDWPNSNSFPGRIAAAGIFPTALADATIEGLTAALQDWADLSPGALWRLNQTSVEALTDLTGNGADQTAITGTAVADDGPAPFNFDVAAGAAQVNVDGNQATTATITGTATVDRTISGDRPTTASLTGTAAVTQAVSGDRATSVDLTGTIDVVAPAVEVQGNRDTTATLTGTATVDRAVDGTRTTTATLTGTAAVDRAVAGDRDTSAALTGTAAVTRTVQGDRPTTATLTGEIDVIQPGQVNVNGDRTTTATLTGTATVARTIAGDRATSVALAGTAQIIANVQGNLAIGVALTGTIDAAPPYIPATVSIDDQGSVTSAADGGGTTTNPEGQAGISGMVS